MLSEQNIDVVMCTIVMYDDVRAWNRANIADYVEIYLEVELEELIRRDQKGIYTRALSKDEKEVAGMNMKTELPKQPDLIIKNYGDISPDDALKMIEERFL